MSSVVEPRGEKRVALLSRYTMWYGRDEPPRELRSLHAGPVTVQLDGADLRYARLGSIELVRRVYAAVRDPNWGTVSMEIDNVEIQQGKDSFEVRFDARNYQDGIDFRWRGTIAGSPDGIIIYDLEGSAARDFRHNKIGLNIHHPIDEDAGRPYRGHASADEVNGTLPIFVGPQRMEGGIDQPLFDPVQDLTIDLNDGIRLHFEFEGAMAEMEDQRNWSDASYKTYMPPQMPGFPYLITEGERVHQRITISVTRLPKQEVMDSGIVEVRLGGPGGTLPEIGLGMAGHGEDLSECEIELLRRIRPEHLRVDLTPGDPGHSQDLDRAIRAAEQLGSALELAIFVDNERQLDILAHTLAQRTVSVARALVFGEGEEASIGPLVEAARRRLAPLLPGVPFAGGTNVYLCELNRNRPHVAALEGVTYSLNPQLHAFDELSLAEAVAAQADGVKTARSFSGQLPIHVSPVTLRPRFNAVATESEVGEAEELPWQVDPRQMSLFGAAWTVGSAKHLAESGAYSVTYYETTGWRGVMEQENGPARPERFPSQPGMVFPLYHVLADLAEWKGGTIIASKSSRPLAVVTLAVQDEEGLHLLIANFTAETQHVSIAAMPSPTVSVRRLDTESVPLAMFDVDAFRSNREMHTVENGTLTLTLQPYATVRVDDRKGREL